MKYGVQYFRTHLTFIFNAPKYFILQRLGGRLTSCKMADNGETKELEEEQLDCRIDICSNGGR
jgi:hypothetical protein